MDAAVLRDKYIEWCKEKVNFNNLNKKVVKIQLPFLDNFSDELVMYAVSLPDGKIKLTDDGWSIDNLESHGVYLKRSNKRMRLLNNKLASYGVELEDEELTLTVSLNHFAEAKNRLLQAMLFTNDMFMLSKDSTSTIFTEDVAQFLEDNNIRTMRNVSFNTTGGLSCTFDFLITGIGNIPTRLIKVLSLPNNSIFAKAILTDITETRKVKSGELIDFYVFFNNYDNKQKSTKDVRPDIFKTFQENNVKPVLFSDRDKVVPELAR